MDDQGLYQVIAPPQDLFVWCLKKKCVQFESILICIYGIYGISSQSIQIF